jgi:hypothetical protein
MRNEMKRAERILMNALCLAPEMLMLDPQVIKNSTEK